MAPNLVEMIAEALNIPINRKPIFEKEKVTVIFVLGGPGAGVCSSSLPLLLRFSLMLFEFITNVFNTITQEKERSAAFLSKSITSPTSLRAISSAPSRTAPTRNTAS